MHSFSYLQFLLLLSSIACFVELNGCAASKPSFELFYDGDRESGLLAIGFSAQKPVVMIDSVHAYDADGNLVLRFVNPVADTPVQGALYVQPGAVEPDKKHTFVVFTPTGEEKIAGTPHLKSQPMPQEPEER